MSEKNNSPLLLAPALLLGVSLLNIGSALGKHEANADGNVRDVQKYDAEVARQLAERYAVRDLILSTPDNGGEQTFTFETTLQGVDEHCNGHYEIRQRAAEVVGRLSCTDIQAPLPTHA